MTNRQLAKIEYVLPGDFQTIARYLPKDESEGRTITVTENEKALFIRNGRPIDRFSAASKPVPWDARVLIGNLRPRHMAIGFGDPERIPYRAPGAMLHAASESEIATADGERIFGMAVVIAFALDKDDSANVQKLLQIQPRQPDVVTVRDLAEALPGLPQAIETMFRTIPATAGKSYVREDDVRLGMIKAGALLEVQNTLAPYGIEAQDITIVVGATSRDAERALPEDARNRRAELEAEMDKSEFEYSRLASRIQANEKQLSLEYDKLGTEIKTNERTLENEQLMSAILAERRNRERDTLRSQLEMAEIQAEILAKGEQLHPTPQAAEAAEAAIAPKPDPKPEAAAAQIPAESASQRRDDEMAELREQVRQLQEQLRASPPAPNVSPAPRMAHRIGTAQPAPQTQSDEDILRILYEATNGDDWENNENWMSDKPLNEWRGVSTDDNGRVTELSLWGNRLSGPIPRELGNLSNLERLSLYFNQLSGPIPRELGNLSKLETLWLDDNELSGPIPRELGNLSKLEGLYLSSNELSGPIPPELGNLSKLEWLNLSSNELSGPIPPELGNLSKLERLDLDDNQLSGPIPRELGNLSKLETLWLNGNQLSGPIPPELGNLSKLERLYLSSNELSGPIPRELGKLSKLTTLWLWGNQLSGPIPHSLREIATI